MMMNEEELLFCHVLWIFKNSEIDQKDCARPDIGKSTKNKKITGILSIFLSSKRKISTTNLVFLPEIPSTTIVISS